MSEVRPKRVCSPKYALQKAKKGKVLNKWELEDLAQTEYAHEYAKLKGSFPEAEPFFLKAIQYDGGTDEDVRYFIYRDFKTPRAVVERVLLKHAHEVWRTGRLGVSPGQLVDFAECVIEGRWAEAEKKILSDRYASREYHRDVVKGRWEELEDLILFSKKKKWEEFAGEDWNSAPRSEVFEEYLAVSGYHPEIERKLEKCGARLLASYAIKGLKGKLPPTLHQKMLLLSFTDGKSKKSAKRYLKFLAAREKGLVKYLSTLEPEERLAILEKVPA
jgi:hypothetical protein